ncbi:MAG: hypothetical protein KKA42_06370, partial [candidate division Zixibacteria bacterium]|nr:hypothetical protein [candidate division Zixibacteria bacterium]
DNDVVVSDSVLLQAIATDAGGVDYVQFYVDGAAIADGADSSLPYQYVWDASDEDLGSVHTIHCVAYDNNGFSTSSDTVTVHYLWRELITDGQELAISRNLEAVYARSSDTLLEFRVKVYDGWNHYTAGDTSGIDCAFFLDTDQNRFTGRDSLGGVISINDIGADYRIVIGYHGDSLTHWSTTGTTIDSGLVDYLIAPDSSNYFEVGVLLSRLGNPSAFDLVVANYTLYKDPLIPADPGTFKFDWAPDQGLGHATYTVDHSWESVSAYRVEGHRLLEAQARPRLTENPFR